MLSNDVLMKKATQIVVDIFGKKYLQDNYKRTCVAHGLIKSNSTFMLFVGIKGTDDLPERQANDHGWVVYAKIVLDAITGNIKTKEYVLE